MIQFKHVTGFPKRRVYKSNSYREARRFAVAFNGFTIEGDTCWFVIL